MPSPAEASQRNRNAEALEVTEQLVQPAASSAWTPMKASQGKLAPMLADSQKADSKQAGPSSLLAAGLHTDSTAGTPTAARTRRFQGELAGPWCL